MTRVFLLFGLYEPHLSTMTRVFLLFGLYEPHLSTMTRVFLLFGLYEPHLSTMTTISPPLMGFKTKKASPTPGLAPNFPL